VRNAVDSEHDDALYRAFLDFDDESAEAAIIYTEAEYRALLVDAGFVDITVQQAGMPGGQALIWARKSG